jgi:hypothetical protein
VRLFADLLPFVVGNLHVAVVEHDDEALHAVAPLIWCHD